MLMPDGTGVVLLNVKEKGGDVDWREDVARAVNKGRRPRLCASRRVAGTTTFL